MEKENEFKLTAQFNCMREFAKKVRGGCVFDRHSFYESLGNYNDKKGTDITPDAVLFWAIDSRCSLLASQIYNFVVADLIVEAKKTNDLDLREEILTQAKYLKDKYDKMKSEDGILN